ncbi:hypothetical protein CTKA_02884 [Chthonomonas calidirosea]|uniref:DUF2325 domain-containing protein n=1 Tax=Chthonomonas calidirosea (strain DSM 23976 / ICMP 18418 / T49) TaxID=1303518 RepID=S0EUL5_CHTCT|nr:hypothetical protein [Chthonomonas calidirosea]CCW35035.1 hypothetical protein CCALI_01217 [Chthonomonas calidirosea T49]CEK20950.1 hypothetical protein CTKA_02884 [Chthonomonas calidirosea]
MEEADYSSFNELQKSIYDSPEALNAYLANLHWRYEQQQWALARLRFFETAIERLETELPLFPESADITKELQSVLANFRSLLEAHKQHMETLFTPDTKEGHEQTSTDQTGLLDASKLSYTLANAEPIAIEESQEVSPIAQNETPSTEAKPIETPLQMLEEVPEAPRSCTTPQPTPPNELRDWLETQPIPAPKIPVEDLRTQVDRLFSQWQALNEQPETESERIVTLFEIRALACEINALYTLDVIYDDQSRSRLEQLQNKILFFREYAKDIEQSLPFEVWDRPTEPAEHAITTKEWVQLAQYFRYTAQAQRALNWWEAHRYEIHPEERHKLLDYIAAAQQLLFRFITQFGGFDKLQEKLYKTITTHAEKEGFLQSLSPDTTLKTLEKRASDLESMVAQEKQRWQRAQQDREREQRQQEVLEKLHSFIENYPEDQIRPETFKEDQRQLLGLLDACRAAGLPPSKKEISRPLIRCIPLLQGQAKYQDFLRYAQDQERKIQEETQAALLSETVEQNTPENAEIADWCSALLPHTEGKKLLIIGGSRKYHKVCADLKERLKLAEAKWLTCEKTTNPAKYEAEIRASDIFMLVVKHVSHSMSEQGRKWIEDAGGRYVALPGGFGEKQIIHCLYEGLVQNHASH